MEIISKQGQWLGDIATREGGTPEEVFELALENGRSITEDLPIGTLLTSSIQARDEAKRIVKHYATNNIHPATETSLILGGIGFMGVEINFLVS